MAILVGLLIGILICLIIPPNEIAKRVLPKVIRLCNWVSKNSQQQLERIEKDEQAGNSDSD
jgi:hypothetical protein